MGPHFLESLQAELAALSMASMKALSGLAALSGDKKEYLTRVLEAGLRDLDKTEYFAIPAERREAFVEQARARYTDIVTGVST